MLGWILRALLIVLFIRALWRLLAGVVQGLTAAPPRRAGGDRPVALVRDPVCGTFVVPSRAVTLGRGEETRYFCSERCRDAYRGARRLRA